jgi:hypothetical protein
MNTFKFWYRWLIVVTITIIVFGLYIALCNQTFLFFPFIKLINTVYNVEPSLLQSPFVKWIFGMLGATMIGWGITIWFILHNSFSHKQAWAWKALLFSTLWWFTIDSYISIITGAIFNFALNGIILISFIIPLIMTFKKFHVQNQ